MLRRDAAARARQFEYRDRRGRYTRLVIPVAVRAPLAAPIPKSPRVACPKTLPRDTVETPIVG